MVTDLKEHTHGRITDEVTVMAFENLAAPQAAAGQGNCIADGYRRTNVRPDDSGIAGLFCTRLPKVRLHQSHFRDRRSPNTGARSERRAAALPNDHSGAARRL